MGFIFFSGVLCFSLFNSSFKEIKSPSPSFPLYFFNNIPLHSREGNHSFIFSKGFKRSRLMHDGEVAVTRMVVRLLEKVRWWGCGGDRWGWRFQRLCCDYWAAMVVRWSRRLVVVLDVINIDRWRWNQQRCWWRSNWTLLMVVFVGWKVAHGERKIGWENRFEGEGG